MRAFSKIVLLLALVIAFGGFLLACEEENRGRLSNFRSPGAMHIQEHCIIDDKLVDLAQCEEKGIALERSLYVASLENGTIARTRFAEKGFVVVDVDRAVPGVSSIVTGDRPQSMASDEFGALLLVISPIENDLSIIALEDNREIAFLRMDKTGRRIWFDKERKEFLVFYADGSLRSLRIGYDCGAGPGVYTIGCKLTKEKLDLQWKELAALDGSVKAIVKNPTKDIIYVSYADRRYVSVVALSESGGACLEGTSYPCEESRIGVGFGCADGIDNDGDTLIDAADAKCFSPWSAEGIGGAGILGKTQCNDGIDNNGDGLFDAFDPGCVGAHDSSEDVGLQQVVLGTCSDGIDNDGNGYTDRDDPSCAYLTDDEDGIAKAHESACADGIDNDADTLIDTADPACYGRMGWSELSEQKSAGRGELGIDPHGRWLYVVEQSSSQVIIVDLEKNSTVNLWGRFPRYDIVGVPSNMIPIAVMGNVEESTIYNAGDDRVVATNSVFYVSSSIGTVQKFLVHEHYEHFKNNESLSSFELFSPRPYDKDENGSYFGVIRCLDILCVKKDLPNISYRKRPAIGFFTDKLLLSDINPTSNKLHTVPTDFNILSETWRVSYEGSLESKHRNDGYFLAEGEFRSDNDFCLLGARPGDRFILTKRDGVRSGQACAAFMDHTKALEWELDEVYVNGFTLKVIAQDGYVQSLPSSQCFTRALAYEVRVNNEWLLTASHTPINKRSQIGSKCVDTALHQLGQNRFTYQADAPIDSQTAFFTIKLPPSAANAPRDFAYEFTTKSGFSPLIIGTGSATTDIQPFKGDNGKPYVLFTDASTNSLYFYDVQKDALEQEM
ncbi:MAG: hypothetical protein WC966_01775 [Bradymonadales bacterium]